MAPGLAAALLSDSYMAQTVACDTAMEAAWYGDDADAALSATATVQLLDCHEYDKTRKLLLASGLPEEYLSWLGLRALELHQRPVSEFVAAHRFQFK